MDPISDQYNQESQKQLSYIETVGQAFYSQCEKLKNEAEKQIAALNPADTNRQDQENRIKLKLKQDLKLVLDQFEKELLRSFGIGLVELEKIYHQKEINKLGELEKEILAL